MHTSKHQGHEYKICLLGDTGVGKSSIVQRFVHNTFNHANENTIGASFMTKTVMLGGVSHKLNIWDTAGQERYRALTPMYYRGANICVIVYDVTCLKSFQSVQSWVKELRTYLTEKCLISIVGNKCDLVEKKLVSQHEAKRYADSVEALFIESSAKNSLNINELFINVVNHYRELYISNDEMKQNISLNNRSSNSNSTCC